MDRYRKLVEAGSSDEEAFEEAFGMSPSEADRQLKTYLTHKISAVVFDLAILEFEPPEPTIRAMSASEIASELGNVALAQGNSSDAQSYFEAAITADPSYSRAHAGLGDAHKFQGHWEQAEPHFQRAVELGPEDALNHLDFAEYFHDKARDEAFADDRKELLGTARRNYVKSQKLDPGIPETYAMYGSTYLEPGEDRSRAVKTLEHANRLLPSSTDILILLAKAYALNGREDEARELVERYVAWSHSTDREKAAAEILSDFLGEPAAEPDGIMRN
jgi:tetratricopeptide (TPR) repeat protein